MITILIVVGVLVFVGGGLFLEYKFGPLKAALKFFGVGPKE